MEDNNLFNKLLDINNLFNAFYKCKQGVGWKASVQKYESNLLINLLNLSKKLENEIYKQKKFYEFDICERGKKRHIKALSIEDRIVQRVLCDEILNPILNKYIIYDNGASVKGKGIDFSQNRLKLHLKRYFEKYKTNKGYILQIDFKKYFENIDPDIAAMLVSEKVKDIKVNNLVNYLLHTSGNGLGIGSQLSQTIGIYYPTKIDNYIKIVKGCKYMGRYMDDIYIIHPDKEFLKILLKDINILCNKYKIILNKKKTQIRKLNKRFTFLKIRYILTNKGQVIMIPNKSISIRERHKLKYFKKIHKPLKDIKNQYKSVKGMLNKYNGYYIIKKLENFYNTLFKEEL